ncbi:MAG TPA: phosphoribosylglycinamide formyltransferase [Niabella sp.]|nr:phosphoribosylglycinamide formyltransferase [Niabella sp.]HOZ95921.1 phosphoribosylglycinamide formyltransferase [Niabella sp.]HQW15833.1 phosphoribosylglycinamide formyltransferase [Niabella sp.]HQX20973.1 phosphoribosylglycinamide formyltransferase [Niabella sp.]HQX41236.1 phosphoribosylglycinamide formyltransferase [Niabella sp.]
MTKKLAIFASGAGSNAQKIIDHFKNNHLAKVTLILCNKPEAGVLHIAQKEGIDSLLIVKEQYKTDGYAQVLKDNGIDLVVLAGFLLKIPNPLIEAFPNRIINIHPALLPKYGGKGMYGQFVHEAVIHNQEKESGITIHFVDEQYDHGATIFQTRCSVMPTDNADSLAKKIHLLEHEHFPRVIEEVVREL